MNRGWSLCCPSVRVLWFSHGLAEDVAALDEPLIEGQYDEISKQVQAFLADCCGGANQSNDALLAVGTRKLIPMPVLAM